MKISEAILLGSTMIRWLPRMTLSADRQAGCALGMMMVASGKMQLGSFPLLTKTVIAPCNGCHYGYHSEAGATTSLAGAIAHMFDVHVMGLPRDWTLERLVEWVATVERESEAINSESVPAVQQAGRPETPKVFYQSSVVTFVPMPMTFVPMPLNPCAYVGLDMEAGFPSTFVYKTLDPALTPV